MLQMRPRTSDELERSIGLEPVSGWIANTLWLLWPRFLQSIQYMWPTVS
jgi:hypothetical protein